MLIRGLNLTAARHLWEAIDVNPFRNRLNQTIVLNFIVVDFAIIMGQTLYNVSWLVLISSHVQRCTGDWKIQTSESSDGNALVGRYMAHASTNALVHIYAKPVIIDNPGNIPHLVFVALVQLFLKWTSFFSQCYMYINFLLTVPFWFLQEWKHTSLQMASKTPNTERPYPSHMTCSCKNRKSR
jgi:hypothetical protein